MLYCSLNAMQTQRRIFIATTLWAKEKMGLSVDFSIDLRHDNESKAGMKA